MAGRKTGTKRLEAAIKSAKVKDVVAVAEKPNKKGANILPEIDWKKKYCGRGKQSSEHVSINLIKGEAGCPKRISVIFRDNMYKNFKSKYLAFGILKNRVYFKPTNDKCEGYLITIKGLTAHVLAGLNKSDVKKYEPFVGSYTLKYDEFYELYYIEREVEENEEERESV